ncbi:MAG: thioredoxin family protein [Pseudomonadota bacterium]
MSNTADRIEAEISQNEKPVILEFHGHHCVPCITQDDLLTPASGHPAFPAKVVSVNVDDTPEIAQRYAVKSVPSIVLIENGKTIAHFSGLVDAGSVLSAIQENQSK